MLGSFRLLLTLINMENVHSKTRLPYIAFAVLMLSAVLALSACDVTTPVEPDNDTVMEGGEMDSYGDESMDGGMMEVDGNMMEKDDAMEKDSGDETVTLDETTESRVASYQLGSVQSYSAELIEELEADNVPYLIDFSAEWCSTCQKNKPKYSDAAAANDGIAFIEADYDTEHDLNVMHKVNKQSTIVAIGSNGEESGRFTGFIRR